jgi:hypothetical protein
MQYVPTAEKLRNSNKKIQYAEIPLLSCTDQNENDVPDILFTTIAS